jgi:hypothetical protein
MRLLVTCCLVVSLLQSASGAKFKPGDTSKDWIQDLRSVPKPMFSADGRFKTFSKHFVRNNPSTGEYTRLSYNCTLAHDQYVDLGESTFSVRKLSCVDNKIFISTSNRQGMEQLTHALAHSPTGLLYGGSQFQCPDVRGNAPGPIYRCRPPPP